MLKKIKRAYKAQGHTIIHNIWIWNASTLQVKSALLSSQMGNGSDALNAIVIMHQNHWILPNTWILHRDRASWQFNGSRLTVRWTAAAIYAGNPDPHQCQLLFTNWSYHIYNPAFHIKVSAGMPFIFLEKQHSKKPK